MEYNVGDVVTIKSWQQMEDEFGLALQDSIPVGGVLFVPLMRRFCETDMTITTKGDGCYTMKEDWGEFYYTAEMFEQPFDPGFDIELSSTDIDTII